MAISDDEIRHVARLARVALGEEEVHRLASDLSRILELVDQVAAADTTTAPPPRAPMRLRADQATTTARELLMAAAPSLEGDLFSVSQVLRDDSGSR